MNKLMLAISALAMCVLTTSCTTTPTFGVSWQGDFYNCISTAADSTIQTVGGDVGGISQEWGVETQGYSIHAGCEAAYVIDYLMPAPGTNNNPGWDWAWIHVASRINGIDESLCNTLWTSLRVYAYWTFQGVPHEELKLETIRQAHWEGAFCDFGFPDNVWMSSAYDRVRAVSQHGGGIIPLQPHYSYFVTNRGP